MGWLTPLVEEYNSALASALPDWKMTLTPSITLVDLFTNFDSVENYDDEDPVHPNARGSQVLADRWFNALQTAVPSGPLRLLVFGDSITEAGTWRYEFWKLLRAAGRNATFVGTRKLAAVPPEAAAALAAAFVDDCAYTGQSTYGPKKLFQSYATDSGVAQADTVLYFGGTAGLDDGVEPVRQTIAAMLSENPTASFLVAQVPAGGTPASCTPLLPAVIALGAALLVVSGAFCVYARRKTKRRADQISGAFPRA